MDIDLPDLKQTINALACAWVMAELPTLRLTYQDYVAAITRLMITISNTERATHIVNAVVDQAIRLKRSSEWVETELSFETSAEVIGDRRMVLNHAIKFQGAGSDASLDLYNERLNRFK